MLHIHDGESSASTAKESTIPGTHVGWREALIDGPAPSDAQGTEWRKLRADFLSDHYLMDRQQCEKELLAQEEMLASFSAHEEVVLWFEHDLFCQTNLLYLLNWFAQQNLGTTRLSLICIDQFPGLGDFRGLGQLNAEQLSSLFDTRHEVSSIEKELARQSWKAFRAVSPTEIEQLLSEDTSALPFLKSALRLHLKRFPFVHNGLGHVENLALELIRRGANDFPHLFSEFGNEEPGYGLGDFQFWLALKPLSETKRPLVRISDYVGAGPSLESQEIRNSRFEITELGRAVLHGQEDYIEMNGIDLWLGGVHLSGKRNLWRWDHQEQRLRCI